MNKAIAWLTYTHTRKHTPSSDPSARHARRYRQSRHFPTTRRFAKGPPLRVDRCGSNCPPKLDEQGFGDSDSRRSVSGSQLKSSGSRWITDRIVRCFFPFVDYQRHRSTTASTACEKAYSLVELLPKPMITAHSDIHQQHAKGLPLKVDRTDRGGLLM